MSRLRYIGRRLPWSLAHTHKDSTRFQELQKRADRLIGTYATELGRLEQVLGNPQLRGKSRERREVQVVRLKESLARVDQARTQRKRTR